MFSWCQWNITVQHKYNERKQRAHWRSEARTQENHNRTTTGPTTEPYILILQYFHFNFLPLLSNLIYFAAALLRIWQSFCHLICILSWNNHFGILLGSNKLLIALLMLYNMSRGTAFSTNCTCAKQRLVSACLTTQFDQSLRIKFCG